MEAKLITGTNRGPYRLQIGQLGNQLAGTSSSRATPSDGPKEVGGWTVVSKSTMAGVDTVGSRRLRRTPSGHSIDFRDLMLAEDLRYAWSMGIWPSASEADWSAVGAEGLQPVAKTVTSQCELRVLGLQGNTDLLLHQREPKVEVFFADRQ